MICLLFEDRWSSEQQLTLDQDFEFSAQLERDYHLRLTHASPPGLLCQETPASESLAQVNSLF